MRVELVTGWVHGWAVSRGTPAPEPRPGGWFVATGTEKEAARHVVWDPAVDVDATGPRTWLKIVAPADEVQLGPGWQPAGTEHLMHSSVHGAAVPLPVGYVVDVTERGGVAQVRVRDDAGRPAARARAGVAGAFAVVDQVVTEPAHRRKGLAAAAMAELMTRLHRRGVPDAVLVATDDGRRLYTALGWSPVSPVTVATTGDNVRPTGHFR